MARKTERLSIMREIMTIEQGSGNVFADLGYPNAEEMLTKARLAQRIMESFLALLL